MFAQLRLARELKVLAVINTKLAHVVVPHDPRSDQIRAQCATECAEGVVSVFPKPVMNCLGPAYSGWALARLLLEEFQRLPSAKCRTRISAPGRQRVMPRCVARGLPLAVPERSRGIHRPNASLQGMLAGSARSQESLTG